MTAEEYFESNVKNSQNKLLDQCPIIDNPSEKVNNMNDQDAPAIISHKRQTSENINLDVDNRKGNLENEASIVNVGDYYKSYIDKAKDENNVDHQENYSYTSRNKFINVENCENILILKENNIVKYSSIKSLTIQIQIIHQKLLVKILLLYNFIIS